MATLLHNITTISTKEILAAGDKTGSASQISICNVDASNDAYVDVFQYDKANNKSYYIIKKALVPLGATLVLERDDIFFDNIKNSLRIQVDDGSTTAVAVDVIIKTDRR
jgi:hypothetical protein|tara:strand:+ start:462 stop:788 length:327 start_codon:yes stop_codon:yes gene_type:complete